MLAIDASEPHIKDPHGSMGGALPLTARVGFQQLAVREADGCVLLLSGFNAHLKARGIASLLELVLHDTM